MDSNSSYFPSLPFHPPLSTGLSLPPSLPPTHPSLPSSPFHSLSLSSSYFPLPLLPPPPLQEPELLRLPEEPLSGHPQPVGDPAPDLGGRGLPGLCSGGDRQGPVTRDTHPTGAGQRPARLWILLKHKTPQGGRGQASVGDF